MANKLDKFIKKRNADDKIYISDVDMWTEYYLPMDKIRKLRDKLMEIPHVKN